MAETVRSLERVGDDPGCDAEASGAGVATGPLWAALCEVMDPEVPVSLVDLGLIYDVRRDGGRVDVDLSFTATACPAMGFIREDIANRLLAEPGIDEVSTHVVWEPAWTPQRITETGRAQLKSFGISL